MTFFPERPKEVLKVIGSFISPVGFIVSFIVNVIAVAEKTKEIASVIMLFSAVIVLGYAIYYVFFAWKIRDNSIKVSLLENEICKGNRYIKNEAKVIIDVEQQKYIIEIEKEYEILSEHIKWFECQFYCNNKLTNANEALEGYKKEPVSWEELNISAWLKYKNPGETDYTEPQDVSVKHVAEGYNYKQFHIEYKTINGDPLDIKKGTKIILTYKYEVSVLKWGSYLNRYITYWGEETIILIGCKDRDKVEKIIKAGLKIYKTNSSGHPVIDPRGKWEETRLGDLCYLKHTIRSKYFCSKYIVSWDANAIFNIRGVDLNTKIGEDQLQLTQY